MRLSELEKYEKIVIQAHDNPDPDAIASSYGLYLYFKSKDKDVKIVYSGRNLITKANVLLMIKECNVPIEYIEENTDLGDVLLITADCQYNEGNVSKLFASHIAIIDHHNGVGEGDYREVHPYLGSCATLVWSLLLKEGFDVDDDILLSTALYYGLMTDTSNFLEISHPLDRDMMDSLIISKAKIKLFSNSNLSLNELEIAGQALIHYDYDVEDKYLVIFSKPCDPNILGLINDIALQVDKVYVSVVYNELNMGYKLSVRSCVKEVKANELASFLTEDIGSGGGHTEKAGGYVDRVLFEKQYQGTDMDEYLRDRLKKYFKNCDIIYAEDYQINTEGMKKYVKKKIKRGFVDPSTILPQNTPITIRTLEGDVDIDVTEDFYILIGLKGEIYPIEKEKFQNKYQVVDGSFEFEAEYDPIIHVRNEGRTINILSAAKACVNLDTSEIYARELTKMVKIFTKWDHEKYYLGKPGDFIACLTEDTKDVYVIERDIFFKTYEEVKE